MSATDELRRLLDERSVEHDDKAVGTSRFTEWDKDENYKIGAAYVEYADGCVLRIYDCTPEQAVSATLGSEREKALEALVRDACWLIMRAEWPVASMGEVASDWYVRMHNLGIEVE